MPLPGLFLGNLLFKHAKIKQNRIPTESVSKRSFGIASTTYILVEK